MKFINYLNKNKYFILFLVFGLIIFCYPMLLSGFDLMPGDGSDVKTFNYLLEHSRLWLLRVPTHEYLWNAPFYYPYDNTLAYSDAIIGLMPIYWFIRLFWSEFSSLQVLFIVMCVLNYSTFYYLLNKCKFKFSSPASSLGAFIFAFGLMRYYRMSHLNYYCQFFTILALIFLLKTDKNNSKIKNSIFFILSCLFMSLQFYSCYTLAFYFCIIAFFMFLISLLFKNPRKCILEYLEKFYIYLLCYIVFLLISLIPFMVHYLDVGALRTVESVIYHSQNSFVWIRNLSILDNLFIKDNFNVDYFLKHEASASSGIITTIIALVGMYKMKNTKWIFYITGFVIFILSCNIFGFNIWEYLYYVIPGSQGIRVVVRISFIALILIGIATANYVDFYKQTLEKKSSKIILTVSIFLILLENIPYSKNPSTTWSTFDWSKKVFMEQIENASKEISSKYKILKFEINPVENYFPNDIKSREYFKTYEITVAIENLAMWTALKNNLYTTNGITGIYRDTRNAKYDKMFFKRFDFDLREFDNEKYLLGN